MVGLLLGWSVVGASNRCFVLGLALGEALIDGLEVIIGAVVGPPDDDAVGDSLGASVD